MTAQKEWPEVRLMRYALEVAGLVLITGIAWWIAKLLTIPAATGMAIVAAVVLLAWAISRASIRIVHAETKIVLERFGKFYKILDPGVYWLWPGDRPRKIVWWYEAETVEGTHRFLGSTAVIDLRDDVLDIPPFKVITSDNALIEINPAVFLKVVNAKKVAYGAREPLREIELLVQTTLRGFIASLDLNEALQARDKIIRELNRVLKPKAKAWGLHISGVEVQTILPSPEVERAMAKQLAADRLYHAAVKEATANADVELIKAEAYREAHKVIADADASTLFAHAAAEAKAIAILADALPIGTKDRASSVIALRYIETWKQMVAGSNAKVVYLPYETSAILNTLAGIREPVDGQQPSAFEFKSRVVAPETRERTSA